MSVSRKSFIKMCVGGACLCGFGSVAKGISQTNGTANNPNESLLRNWLGEILKNLDDGLEEETVRSIVKSASSAHYAHNRMDEMIAPYKGNVRGFTDFLEKEWGWKVTYENNGKVITVDEQKPYCVCPLVAGDTQKYPALCYCSEGFAEKMFSNVIGKPVNVSITSAVQRGDTKCMYRVEVVE